MSDSNVGILSRAPTLRMLTAARLPNAPLTALWAECLAVALLAPLFLSIAIWNGFPMTFYDTGAYILQGLANYFVPERAPVYSYFLRFAGAQQSLWLVAAAQTTIIAFVVTQFARAEKPETSLWQLLGIGGFLCLFTSIGWVSGEIEPDCFTAVVVMSVWLLAFRARELGAVRGAMIVLIASFATAAHPSHLGLAAGLALVVIAYRLAILTLGNRVTLPKANPFLPIVSFALGISLILTANYALTKHVFLSKSGAVFMTAKLIEDGVVKEVLDETCPHSGYILCRYKDHLPATADDYLWETNSPFNKLGRFRGSAKESQAIMVAGLTGHPFQELGAALKSGARQFFMFRTGDGIAPQEWVLATEFRNFLPQQIKAYSMARQQREEFSFVLLNVVHVGLGALALFVLGLLIWNGLKRRAWAEATLPAFMLIALLGNAIVCGATSGPHDRYQGRLIWVPVFVVILTARPALLALRREAESGT